MRRLTEQERKELAEALIAGESPTELSRRYPVSRQYLSQWKSRLQGRGDRRRRPAEFDFTNAREELRREAYPALKEGLQHRADNYKRARLGLETLRGTGDLFREEQGMTININAYNQKIRELPPGLREGFVELTDGESDALAGFTLKDEPPELRARFVRLTDEERQSIGREGQVMDVVKDTSGEQ